MARRIGSTDRFPRKSRSDKGLPRKTYKGKPVKTKSQKRYERRQGNKSVLKLWIWECCPMKPESRLRWNKYVRHYASNKVFPGDRRLRVDTDVSMINSKAKIEDFIMRHMGYPGHFYLFGFSHGKNKFGVKPKCMAEFSIKETGEGLNCRMIKNRCLSRYKWFYKG